MKLMKLKRKLKSQTVLKGLLFAVLASQISWNTAFHETLMTVDLAQTSGDVEEKVGGTGEGGTTPPATTSEEAPPPPAPSKSAAKGARPNGDGPDAPATVPSKTAAAPPIDTKPVAEPATQQDPAPRTPRRRPERTTRLNLCSVDFNVTYSEFVDNHTVKTKVDVSERFIPDFQDLALRPSGPNGKNTGIRVLFKKVGSYEENVNDPANKEQLDTAIKREIEYRLGRNLCDPNSVIPVNQTRRREQEEDDGTKEIKRGRERERERETKEDHHIAKGVEDCRLDENGKKLTKAGQTECNIDKLNELMEADFDDENDTSRETVMTEVEELVRGPLKNSLKAQLLSNSQAEIKQGNKSVDEAIKTLRSLAKVQGLDSSETNQLINELTALKLAGETSLMTQIYGDQMNKLRMHLSNAQTMFDQNPNSFYALQALQSAQNDYLVLSNYFNGSLAGPYTRLQMASGYMSADDLNDFTSPVMALQQYMTAMGDPNRLRTLGPFDMNSGSSLGRIGMTTSLIPGVAGTNESYLGTSVFIPRDLYDVRSMAYRDRPRSNGVLLNDFSSSPLSLNAGRGNWTTSGSIDYGKYGMSGRVNPLSTTFNSGSLSPYRSTGFQQTQTPSWTWGQQQQFNNFNNTTTPFINGRGGAPAPGRF